MVTGRGDAHYILLVDDEPDNLETLCLLLRDEGFRVECVTSAAEAVNSVRQDVQTSRLST